MLLDDLIDFISDTKSSAFKTGTEFAVTLTTKSGLELHFDKKHTVTGNTLQFADDAGHHYAVDITEIAVLKAY